MTLENKKIFESLKKTIDSYYPISKETWQEFEKICTIKTIKKNEYAFDVYDKVDSITFVYKGLFRSFSTNENGEEYNKNFFWETRFYGPIVSLLRGTPIDAAVQALEDSVLVDINYEKYRELLYKSEDFKLFHILYLEKHWVVEKDDKGYSLVLEDAILRYKRFLEQYANIVSRLSQYHIASFLGISPTHLSRVRKELKNQNVN